MTEAEKRSVLIHLLRDRTGIDPATCSDDELYTAYEGSLVFAVLQLRIAWVDLKQSIKEAFTGTQ